MNLRQWKTSCGKIFANTFDDGIKNAHVRSSVGSIPLSIAFQGVSFFGSRS
jgi:hypothetical protein